MLTPTIWYETLNDDQAYSVDVANGPHFQMLLSSKLGGDTVTLSVRKRDEEQATSVGPLVLADAPWSEQQKATTEELPASFPLPEKK